MKQQVTKPSNSPIISAVYFVSPAMINHIPTENVSTDKFTISFHNDLLMIVDKNNKSRYLIPLSNIRNVRLADE